MSEKIASFVQRQINRLGRVRDAVYLDTNAWSTLAKCEIPYEPLRAWVEERGYHIWMARFQMAELARDTRIARPLADLLRKLPVVMLDRAQNEFQGEPWYSVKAELAEHIRLDDGILLNEFVNQLTTGPIREIKGQLIRDAENFRVCLEESLASIPIGTPRNWSQFPKRLDSWIRSKCNQNGVPVNEDGLADPKCYVGLRLSYGVLFVRYFLNRQRWEPSDYIDYLHAADMAYAGAVVTERNLAECLRQVAKRPEVMAPETIVDLGWFANPVDRTAAG